MIKAARGFFSLVIWSLYAPLQSMFTASELVTRTCNFNNIIQLFTTGFDPSKSSKVKLETVATKDKDAIKKMLLGDDIGHHDAREYESPYGYMDIILKTQIKSIDKIIIDGVGKVFLPSLFKKRKG